MSPSEVTSLLDSIDRAVRQASDRQARRYAVALWTDVADRPNGSQILAPQVSHIASFLNDADDVVRKTVLYTLARIATRNPDAVQSYLVSMLQSPNQRPALASAAASILASHLDSSPSFEPDIIAFLKRSDLTPEDRVKVINALGRAHVRDRATITELIANLQSSDQHVQTRTIVALSRLRPSFNAQVTKALQGFEEQPGLSARTVRLAHKAGQQPIGDDPDTKDAQEVH